MFCIFCYSYITVLFSYSAFELQECSDKLSSVQFSIINRLMILSSEMRQLNGLISLNIWVYISSVINS